MLCYVVRPRVGFVPPLWLTLHMVRQTPTPLPARQHAALRTRIMQSLGLEQRGPAESPTSYAQGTDGSEEVLYSSPVSRPRPFSADLIAARNKLLAGLDHAATHAGPRVRSLALQPVSMLISLRPQFRMLATSLRLAWETLPTPLLVVVHFILFLVLRRHFPTLSLRGKVVAPLLVTDLVSRTVRGAPRAAAGAVLSGLRRAQESVTGRASVGFTEPPTAPRVPSRL